MGNMRWSYKTVHYELKKEGLLGSAFLDESEMELSLNEYGKAGWELVSVIENMDGLVAVFKQPLSLENDFNFSVEQGEEYPDIPERQVAEDAAVLSSAEVQVEKGVQQYDFADKGVFSRKRKKSEAGQGGIGDIRIE